MDPCATSTPVSNKRKLDSTAAEKNSVRKKRAGGAGYSPTAIFLDKSDIEVSFPKSQGSGSIGGGNKMSEEEERDDRLLKKMNENFEKAVDRMDNKFRERYDDLHTKVTENTSEIAGMREAIRRIEREVVGSPKRGPIAAIAGPSSSDQRRDSYYLSRRSIRLWPVPGMDDETIRANTIKFLRRILKVEEEDVGDDDIVKIRRIRTARNSKTVSYTHLTLPTIYSV